LAKSSNVINYLESIFFFKVITVLTRKREESRKDPADSQFVSGIGVIVERDVVRLYCMTKDP